MKLRFFFTVLIWGLTVAAFAQKVQLLVGSAANTQTDGIYIYEFDTLTGDAVFKNKTTVNRPSYMALSADRAFLYAITDGENVSAYTYKKNEGTLGFLNKQSSGGKGPIHISIDNRSRYIFSSNYDGGSLTVLPVQKNGGLGEVSQTLLQEGKSIDSLRQTKPYVHSAVLSPDNNFLFMSDLGTDKINIYRINKNSVSQPLIFREFIKMNPGSGPRFFTFHPTLKKAYVIQELAGMFTAFTYNGTTLVPSQSISMTDGNFRGKSGAADLHVSPDGKFMYGSNRGDANELAIFAIDERDGKLTFVSRYPSALKRPRYFAIDPSGNFLLLTNQGSDNITILKRDKKTGLLSSTGQVIPVSKPACIQFVD